MLADDSYPGMHQREHVPSNDHTTLPSTPPRHSRLSPKNVAVNRTSAPDPTAIVPPADTPGVYIGGYAFIGSRCSHFLVYVSGSKPLRVIQRASRPGKQESIRFLNIVHHGSSF